MIELSKTLFTDMMEKITLGCDRKQSRVNRGDRKDGYIWINEE